MNHATQKQNTLSKDSKIKLIWVAGLSIFWVIFVWNFWDVGPYALGVNAFVFLLLLLGLFVWVLRKKSYYTNSDLLWIIPIGLMALSYALYDNPFLKVISILVIPATAAVFYNQAFLNDKQTKHWNVEFVIKIIGRFFLFVPKIAESASAYLQLIIPTGKTKKQVVARIVGGVVLFLIIALTVFIPLLSSADAVFASKMQLIYDWSQQLLSLPVIYKVLVVIIFSVGIYAVLTAWSARFEYTEKDSDTKKVDSIVTGIVMGGTLCLYLLFLWVQISQLWVGALPFDFKETENLVKSGFWQLFVLSLINIAIYFFAYKKTSVLVQRILVVFTIASLLLLISAGYRMSLYVTYYGLSYEKFFATYTVVYCAILFVWLISRLFVSHRSNIVKFLVVLFIWMYALLVVTPVEHVIVRTNVALSQLSDSRVRLFEMTMLSLDVLGVVEEYQSQGKLVETVGYLARENEQKSQEQFDWNPWIQEQREILNNKRWFEMNVMNAMYWMKK